MWERLHELLLRFSSPAHPYPAAQSILCSCHYSQEGGWLATTATRLLPAQPASVPATADISCVLCFPTPDCPCTDHPAGGGPGCGRGCLWRPRRAAGLQCMEDGRAAHAPVLQGDADCCPVPANLPCARATYRHQLFQWCMSRPFVESIPVLGGQHLRAAGVKCVPMLAMSALTAANYFPCTALSAARVHVITTLCGDAPIRSPCRAAFSRR